MSVANRQARPSRIRSEFFEHHPKDHPDKALADQPITRPATCGCGDTFRQFILSAAFLEACETIRGGAPLRAVQAQIPGLWVPVHCPRCERVDLQRQARLDEIRRDPSHYVPPEAA